MAENPDISIGIVLKEQVTPALDALSGGILEFTRALSILTAQAKSAGDAIGQTGDRAEQTKDKVATAVKPVKDLADEERRLGQQARESANSLARFGVVLSEGSNRIRFNLREVEALVSSYARFKQSLANSLTALQNQIRGLGSLKDAFADLRFGLNNTIGTLTSFKALAIAAVATLGAFRAKSFIESIVGDAARLDETLRKAAAAVGSLNEATTEKLREDLKRLAIEEGADIRALAEAAIGVIPDVGEEGIADFIRVAQRFSEVAGGNVAQIADTLVFIIKGFGTEAENSEKSLSELASTISDKLFVAAREGNIAIGQLTGIVGLAAQQAEVLGISFDELLAAFTALGDIGVKPMRAFRVLSGVLGGLQEPSLKVVQAVKRVNDTIPNLQLDFSRAGLATDGLAKFLGKLTVALNADDELAKDLGINIREMGLIFKATANEGRALAEQLENIQKSGGEVNRAADFILEGTEGKLRRIGAVFAALKDDIAQILIPAIDEFLGNFQQGIEGLRNSFGGSLSAIRQAVQEIRGSQLGDDQKKQAIASLEELQRQVNRAGLLILAEAIKAAFVAGGKIVADLIFAAFAKAGLILKGLIMEALGKPTPSATAARLEAAKAVIERTVPNLGTLPKAIPTQEQTGDLVRAIFKTVTEAQRLSNRQALTGPDAPVDNKILDSAKELAQAVKDAVARLPDQARAALILSGAIDEVTNEVKNLQLIATESPELFKEVVAAVLKTQDKVITDSEGIDFNARTNPTDILRQFVPARNFRTGIAPLSPGANISDAEYAHLDFLNASLSYVENLRTLSQKMFEGFGPGGAGFGATPFVTDAMLTGDVISGGASLIVGQPFPIGPGPRPDIDQQAAALDIIQKYVEQGQQLPQLNALRSLIEKSGVGGKTLKEIEELLRKAQVERDEENAVVSEFVIAAMDDANDTAQKFSRLIAALGRAQTPEELTDVLVNLGDAAGDFGPLVQRVIDLHTEGDRAVAALNKIGAEIGLTAKKGEDGLISLVKTTDELGQTAAAAQSAVAVEAQTAANALEKTSYEVGAAQQRISEQVGDSAITLAKRFAQADIARRTAIGSVAEKNIVVQINEAVKRVDNLKEQIAKIETEALASVIGKDKAVSEIGKLRKQLQEQAQILFRFVPDASDIYKTITNLEARINELRARAEEVSTAIGLLAVLPNTDEQALQTLRTESADIEAELRQKLQDFRNQLVVLVRASERAAKDEMDNVIRAAADKSAGDAQSAVIEVAKRTAKMRQEVLRVLFKNDVAAQQSEAIVADLERLVSQKAEAVSKGLSDEVDQLNKEIAGKLADLVATLEDSLPADLRGAFDKVVQSLKNIQTATGDGARDTITRAGDDLTNLIKVLFSVQKQLGVDLSEFQKRTAASEAEFARRRQARTQLTQLAEPVVQRLAIGPEIPTGGRSLTNRSPDALAKAVAQTQLLAKEIQAITNSIQYLEGELDKIRSTEIGPEFTIGDRDSEIAKLEAVIEKYQQLLKQKLAVAGAPIVSDTEADRIAQSVEQTKQLVGVQSDLVRVNEVLRKAAEDQGEAQRKLANSQKLAAAAGQSQYATLEAVYGLATFQIDKTTSRIEQQRAALKQYIAALTTVKNTLDNLANEEPDAAGSIQPELRRVTDSLVDAQTELASLGQSAGASFKEGFVQGLGAAEDYLEFAANLGRGLGGAIQGNLGAAIDSVVEGTKTLGEAFQDFVSDTLVDIGKLIVKMLILQAIQSAVGLFSGGGVVMEAAGMERGGPVLPRLQPRRLSGYNEGGSVVNSPKSPSQGFMARISNSISALLPTKPLASFSRVGAYREGGLVKNLGRMFVGTPVLHLNEGGSVDEDGFGSVLHKMSSLLVPPEMFASTPILHLNEGGPVNEDGLGSVLHKIASILTPPEPQVLALADGGVAYLDGGGFPSSAPRRQGRVPGPSIDRDIVPAMLTPGEFVMKRDAVSNYGLGVMYALNQGLLPKTMFGDLPGVRTLATGGTAEAAIPPRIEISSPAQAPAQAAQASVPQSPIPAYIVANEQAMQNLLNGGRNAMLDFMRRNK